MVLANHLTKSHPIHMIPNKPFTKRGFMTLPNRKGWLAVFFILFTLAIPFAITYYVSTDSYKERFRGWRKNNEAAGLPSHSKISQNEILLMKDEKVIIDRTCLVYKGIKDKQLYLDLYLLDFDPEQPYTRNISKDAPPESIKLGNNVYSINSANNRFLKLKILNRFNTL